MPPSLDGRRGTLKKGDFEKILEANKPHDYKMNFRLTSNHLNLVGSQAQRVRLAAQVFSRTNAKSFLFLSGIFQGSQAKAKHDACLVFDQWFDTMNSRIKNHSNPMLCGLGTGINSYDQMRALEQMETFLSKMQIFDPSVNGGLKKSPMPWQTGILCSIKSTRALHQDLVVNGSFEYILTARLNQDALENFFSRIRGMYVS